MHAFDLFPVQYLRQQPGINLELMCTEDELTVLMVAAKKGKLEIVKELLVAGSEINAEGDKSKRTALGAALEGSQVEVELTLFIISER